MIEKMPPPSLLFLAILDVDNNPIIFRSFIDEKYRYDLESLAFSMLDFVDEKILPINEETKEGYLGILITGTLLETVLDEYIINISGFVTNTKLKFFVFRKIPELLTEIQDHNKVKQVRT